MIKAKQMEDKRLMTFEELYNRLRTVGLGHPLSDRLRSDREWFELFATRTGDHRCPTIRTPTPRLCRLSSNCARAMHIAAMATRTP